MAETYDLILKGGTVVNQDGEGIRDIGIRDGRFATIGDLSRASAGEAIDCRGLHVLPGVIDSHVHFREPGLTHKEDLESGSRGAVLGGVTAVFEMPNTDPTTTDAAAIADKVKRAHHRMHCDFAFYVGATRENTKDLGELERLPGVCGVKVFMGSSTGSLLIEDDAGVRAVLKSIRRRAAFHSEDEYRLRERMNLRVEGDPRSHPVWRDAQAALMCTQRLIALAHETGKRVHVLHVTSKEEAEFLAGHKDVATAEATPAHLTLAAPDCYEKLGTLAQLNPPVRDASHREGLWRGIAQGVIDSVGSDHSPHTREEKAHPYPKTHSGMPGHADAGAADARSRQRWAAIARALCRSHQRRTGARVRHRAQRPHRRRLRRRSSPWSISSGARPSPTNGSPRAPAGRLTTASALPAGRSAPSCADTK